MSRGLMAGLALVLVASACGGGDADPPPLTDPSSVATTSTAAASTSTTASTSAPSTATTVAGTTTTAEDVERVGSIEAFEAQVDAVYEVHGPFAAPRDEVPFPDATNTDPLAAFQSLIEFHFWMVSTNPWPEWVQLYALDNTQYALDRRNQADRYAAPPSLMLTDGPPFTVTAVTEIPIASIGAPDTLTEGLPEQAVGIEFTSLVGDLFVEDTANGVVYERYDGWEDLTSQAIVVATDAGWRIGYLRWND